MTYYHLKDMQNFGQIMHSGRNSKDKEELKDGLLSFISVDHSEKEMKKLRKLSVGELCEMFEFDIEETSSPIEEDHLEEQVCPRCMENCLYDNSKDLNICPRCGEGL